ncbi:chemotaxis protein CheX [Sulfurospirillum sp. 1612]|uniref:chemotaxis protein CheX n=1 Tax=Sulfurospirillum sp. 1612 TaxID=3094835 RepID=UPI002F94665E
MENYINMGLVIFEYKGVIKKSQNALLVRSITTYIKSIDEEEKPENILVSLKSASTLDHYESLALLVKALNLLSKEYTIVIALIHYDETMYEILKPLSKKTLVKLFKTFDIARLYLKPYSYKKNSQVLICDRDAENARNLSLKLSLFENFIITTHDASEPDKLTNLKHYQIVVTQSALNLDLEKHSNTNLLKLSKKLISALPFFMESAVNALETVTELSTFKSSHAVGSLEKDLKPDQYVYSIMKFRGDLEGTFVLIFPKENAWITLMAFLKETINSNDVETLKDGIGELCNIITGSTKSALSKRHINILFEIPITFTTLKQTLAEIKNDNGIIINMLLNNKPFYLFVTR